MIIHSANELAVIWGGIFYFNMSFSNLLDTCLLHIIISGVWLFFLLGVAYCRSLFSFIGEARAYSQIWHYLLLFKICDLSFVLLGSSAIKSLADLKSWENSLWALDHSGWELKNSGECLWSSIKANAFCISHTLR